MLRCPFWKNPKRIQDKAKVSAGVLQAIFTRTTLLFRVTAIRTAGSTADWRLAALLIELEAQFYKLVTL